MTCPKCGAAVMSVVIPRRWLATHKDRSRLKQEVRALRAELGAERRRHKATAAALGAECNANARLRARLSAHYLEQAG